MPDPITNRHKKHLRNLERNKSGRKATVKMEYSPNEVSRSGSGKIVHAAHPSITFTKTGKEKDQSIDEAAAAGELYEFKRKRRAERFAAGSWKKGKEKREAMKAFRAKKKEDRQKKRNG